MPRRKSGERTHDAVQKRAGCKFADVGKAGLFPFFTLQTQAGEETRE